MTNPSASNRSQPARRYTRRAAARRGLSLVAVMVVCAVLSMLTMSMVRTMAGVQRQMRRELHTTQCRWLVEAGLERAAARIRSDEEYTGETWELGADELAGPLSAVVQMEVTAPSSDAAQVHVLVTAVLGDDTSQRVQQSREFIVARQSAD